ncbi:pyridoxal phosphate-dependent transferase [Aspergillus alliaceus]|uniref:pyridoxal phosphate-dependent transferase n=1 Tax=Petromyces alliaceus TaxID=209559 RepID=UPI0012A4F178|nr:pyridoxal phosphate-dependent transferase [Aspergillus alliaceus]KAB8234397.1 pyridoxal phosphate-dependent transferase [Aspergillus alliaceus]
MRILSHLLALSTCCWYVAAVEPTQSDHLSNRSTVAIKDIQGWKILNDTVLSKPYDPDRYPQGIINLGLAENWLIQTNLSNFLKENFTIDPLFHLTYGQGPAASPRLRKALADFFNANFSPRQKVSEYEIIVASGVTSLIDSIAWTTCNVNEGIIIPQPLYNGFPTDIHLRSQAKLIPASFLWDNQTYSLDKSKEALIEIARFCGQNNIHFISDEIYANSVFEVPKNSTAPPFTSVLSLDLDGIIDPNLVHVLYGMSKDFGASGLRLGVLHSRNEQLIQAAYGVNLFSWPSYLAQDMWARLLEDTGKTQYFLNLNRERLAKSYKIVTSWLDLQGIEYYTDGNAGLFVWARIFRSNIPDPNTFLKNCQKHGVNVGNGQNFLAESGQTGWYRITFSYPPSMLKLGLDRLNETLHDPSLGGNATSK